jgi:hypothetical protein
MNDRMENKKSKKEEQKRKKNNKDVHFFTIKVKHAMSHFF